MQAQGMRVLGSEGQDRQTDTGAQGLLLWETKDSRSRFGCSGSAPDFTCVFPWQGLAVRDPQANPQLALSLPWGSCACTQHWEMLGGGCKWTGRGEGISWAQQEPGWGTNRLSQGGQSASSVIGESLSSALPRAEQPRLGSTRNELPSSSRQGEKQPPDPPNHARDMQHIPKAPKSHVLPASQQGSCRPNRDALFESRQ